MGRAPSTHKRASRRAEGRTNLLVAGRGSNHLLNVVSPEDLGEGLVVEGVLVVDELFDVAHDLVNLAGGAGHDEVGGDAQLLGGRSLLRCEKASMGHT